MKKLRKPPREPPLKWQKYMLLVAYGLAEQIKLAQTIARFPWQNHAQAVDEVHRAFERERRTDGVLDGSMFVVKFVRSSQSMRLPNHRVRTANDLVELRRRVSSVVPGEFAEIWFCRMAVGVGQLNVAGRILVDQWGGLEAQTIEQLWRCSPRLIDQLSEVLPYPFVRATRAGWTWPPRIRHVHIPPNANESPDELLQQFGDTLRLIERLRPRLEYFAEKLHAAGATMCAIEYKVEAGALQIIDWDTADDSSVIEALNSRDE